MDKYQKYLLENIRFETDTKKTEGLSDFQWDGTKIILTQNPNYNITKYEFFVRNLVVSKVEHLIGKKYVEGNRVDEYTHSIEVDFTKKSNKIRIHFENELADPIVIPVEYVDADKEAYDAKVAEQLKYELAEKVNVQANASESIITVTFKPLNDTYSYSKVELYLANVKPGTSPATYDYQLMAKYKTEEDVYFHSIINLAYGTYAVVVVQYDSSNKEIYRSDYVRVTVKSSSTSNNGSRSKPVVTARYL